MALILGVNSPIDRTAKGEEEGGIVGQSGPVTEFFFLSEERI
jgi:hypothetical protein